MNGWAPTKWKRIRRHIATSQMCQAWRLSVYKSSLSLALVALFLASFFGHCRFDSVNGARPSRSRCTAIVLFRFRRSFLVEEDCQDHVERHLQELALPVLEDGLTELARRQKRRKRDRCTTMQPLFGVMRHPSSQGVSGQRYREQDDQDDREVVMSPQGETASRRRHSKW